MTVRTFVFVKQLLNTVSLQLSRFRIRVFILPVNHVTALMWKRLIVTMNPQVVTTGLFLTIKVPEQFTCCLTRCLFILFFRHCCSNQHQVLRIIWFRGTLSVSLAHLKSQFCICLVWEWMIHQIVWSVLLWTSFFFFFSNLKICTLLQ